MDQNWAWAQNTGGQPQQIMDYGWVTIVNSVRYTLLPHEEMEISKLGYTHPLQAGFRLDVGEPKGQVADYRFQLSDGSGIHVVEFQDCYTVHWDKVDLLTNFVEHINQDAPQWGPVLGLVVGGLIFGGLIWLDSQK